MVKIVGMVVGMFAFVSLANWLTGPPVYMSPAVDLFVGEPIMLLAAIAGILIDRKYNDRLRISWKKVWTGVPLAILVMACSAGIVTLIHRPTILMFYDFIMQYPHPVSTVLGQTALAILVIGLAEESFFRGYLFEYLTSGPFQFRVVSASIIVGFLFGLFHTSHDLEMVILHHASFRQEWLLWLYQYAYGVASCLLYAWTSNIVFVIVLHGIIDSPLGLMAGTHGSYLPVIILTALVIVPALRVVSFRASRSGKWFPW